MSNPIRIQRKRTKGWKMPANTVYVGRGSRFGNPYVVGRDGTAEECVEKYKKYWLPYSHAVGDLSDFYISRCNLSDIVHSLQGKNLACWCKLTDTCHADWLLSAAQWLDKEDIENE